jgi:hypothetical protein
MPRFLEGKYRYRKPGNVREKTAGHRRRHLHARVLHAARFGNDTDEHPDQASQSCQGKDKVNKRFAFKIVFVVT